MSARKSKVRLTCTRPDRDVPKIVCGYPLPCPYHTVIIDATEAPTVVVPPHTKLKARTRRLIGEIARSLKVSK